MTWEVDSPEYQQALSDYEDVLARPAEDWRAEWVSESSFELLQIQDSQLDKGDQELLESLGFSPVVALHSETKFGDSTGEWWVESSKGLVVSVGLTPATLEGKHFVNAYFTDGTAFTVWPSDSMSCDAETPPRENVRGVDDLEQDIRTGLHMMEDKLAEGVRALVATDVHTADLRTEFYDRFIQPNPYQTVAAALDNGRLFEETFGSVIQTAEATTRKVFFGLWLLMAILTAASVFLLGTNVVRALAFLGFITVFIVVSARPFSKAMLDSAGKDQMKEVAVSEVLKQSELDGSEWDDQEEDGW